MEDLLDPDPHGGCGSAVNCNVCRSVTLIMTKKTSDDKTYVNSDNGSNKIMATTTTRDCRDDDKR